MTERLSPANAGAIATRARKLLRLGKITHHQAALLDALLWSCRKVGAFTARVSYGQLQATAHMARSTVAAGLRALEALGLIQRIRHRLLAIGANGGRVWRQLTSSYRLLSAPSREFEAQTDTKTKNLIHVVDLVPSAAVKNAQEALRAVAERMHARQAIAWVTRSAR